MSDTVEGYGPQEALIGPAPTSRVGRFLEGIQRRMREFRENAGPATPEVAKGGAALIDALIGRAPEAYADAAAGRPLVRKPNAQQSWMRANEPLVDAAGLVPGGGTVAKGAQGVQMGMLPLAALLRTGRASGKGSVADAIGIRRLAEDAIEAQAKGRPLPPMVYRAQTVGSQSLDDPELLRLIDPDRFSRPAIESALRTEKFDWSKLEPNAGPTARALEELDNVPLVRSADYSDPGTLGSAIPKDEYDPALIGLSRGYLSHSKNPVQEALEALAHERQHTLQDALGLSVAEGRRGTNTANYDPNKAGVLARRASEPGVAAQLRKLESEVLALNPTDPQNAAWLAYRRNPGELEARLTEYVARGANDPTGLFDRVPREKVVAELERLSRQAKPYIPGIEEISRGLPQAGP